MPNKQPWMTKTGAILSAISGALVGAAQLCPVASWVPWINFAAAILGGVALGLIGQGIRRKLPATPEK